MKNKLTEYIITKCNSAYFTMRTTATPLMAPGIMSLSNFVNLFSIMFYGVTFFNKHHRSIHHPQENDYSTSKCKEMSLAKNYLINLIYFPLNTYSHCCFVVNSIEKFKNTQYKYKT